MSALVVGDLSFELRTSDNRRTMQITVDRGGELILAAPTGIKTEHLRDFVVEKRFWIYTKLAEKNRLQRIVPTKEYLDGEGFLHLGTSYRLRLVDEQLPPLKLIHGRFCLCRSEVAHGRLHFVRWYSTRAQPWLWAKVQEYAPRMEVRPSGVTVQDLGHRWGSCGKHARLYFHWMSILLPARIAEYVVVHELAHLHEPHHTPAFWRRIERAMPDFERRKTWLAENGMSVEGM